MSRSADVPLRVIRPRQAKQDASMKITEYFKPNSLLQLIPEDSEVVFKKGSIQDKNNNSKRNFKQLSPVKSNKNDDKVKQTKSKEVTEESKTKAPPSKKNKLKSPSVASSLSELVLFEKNPAEESDSVIIVDSSVVSIQSDEGFDGLQTDDSTADEEDETNQPYWSLYKNRIAIVIDQCDVSTDIVDNLFNVKPQSVELCEIFPKSTPIARRRSTCVWKTPPRYSMLPKY